MKRSTFDKLCFASDGSIATFGLLGVTISALIYCAIHMPT